MCVYICITYNVGGNQFYQYTTNIFRIKKDIGTIQGILESMKEERTRSFKITNFQF